ncbi:tellurite resistance protein [Rhodovulum iodosum]|uniref:Tellurite resistance protein n=1 Tax=Rhodovulum iodosum TaxID=68291 RepID=A0ABV3XUP8_9RHOB|nr:tellurium resistance protein [Rhodovulum robiginosum]RSK35105.1 tellurium resistance protein [Rhodovulum robiginosum]
MTASPPPFLAPQPRFGEQTPPAIFPPIMGAFGLGLAWRRGAEALAAPAAVGDLVLGAVTLLFLFCAGAYLRKVLRRPGVVIEDLKVLPGRAGLAAMVLSVYLLAAALVPFSPGAALGLMSLALALNAGLAALVLYVLVTGPAEQRAVTPVWHLQFVGFILAGLTSAPLGYDGLSALLLYGTGAVAVLIWALSLVQIVRRDPPPPLRPLLAIHLAPAAVLGTVALLAGQTALALGLAALAAALFAALALRAPYILRAGFSPLWGAFTFPLAAFASLLLGLGAAGQGGGLAIAGGLVLVAATLVIPPILVKVLQAWAKGGLAPKTNAARA